MTGAAATPPGRILIADKDLSVQRDLASLLTSRGFEVESATTGPAALRAFRRRTPDLIVLDLCLAGVDGFELCRRIRAQSDLPIIVLSAHSADSDKVTALDQGADDYVIKPFSREELLARIRVALRRTLKTLDTDARQIRHGDLVIDFARHRVRRGAETIRLTPKEFELLTYFVRHPNQVLTHTSILTAIWGPEAADRPANLWVLIRQLRRKLERDLAHPQLLITEPWIGYRLVTDQG